MLTGLNHLSSSPPRLGSSCGSYLSETRVRTRVSAPARRDPEQRGLRDIHAIELMHSRLSHLVRRQNELDERFLGIGILLQNLSIDLSKTAGTRNAGHAISRRFIA